MPKEHKYICKRSEASILDATSQFEGLNAIVSKEWIDEVQIRRWYHLPEHSSTLLGTLHHKKSWKNLRRIDGQMMESTGILHVVSLT